MARRKYEAKQLEELLATWNRMVYDARYLRFLAMDKYDADGGDFLLAQFDNDK